MASLNRVFLMGNLTRDPEVRYAPSGDAVGDLQMAVNRKYKSRDGQDREETCFVGVVVWGRQAETCAEYLRKGSPLLVEGRLQYDQWEKEGQKFSRLRVRASRVQFMGSPKGAEFRDGEGATPVKRESEAKSVEKTPPGVENSSNDAASADDDNLPF